MKTTKLTHGDCIRITQTLGLLKGEYHSSGDDARGLGFTVCGGNTIYGENVPWISQMNGWPVEDIASEALKRNAVRRVSRWKWERTDLLVVKG